MIITAQMVKEFRKRTGAGILDSKNALEITNGNFDKAVEFLDKKGILKAIKKSSRIAAEGLVYTTSNNLSSVIIEVNSETDFVSKNYNFKKMVKTIAEGLLSANVKIKESALKVIINNETIEKMCINTTAIIGEKISFRRYVKLSKNKNQFIGEYTHNNGQIASLVIIDGGSEEVAKNLAMQIAAMNPEFIDENDMPKNIITKYKTNIFEELSLVKKPINIIKKMAEGKFKKILSELTLVEQNFILDNKITVSKYLQITGAKVISMVRFRVGEGIKKNSTNFVSEVAAQIKK